jgi:choline dehydrogenase
MQPLIEGIRIIRKIFDASPFREHYVGEMLPGTQYQTDEQLTDYLRAKAQSMYHPVGTCKMGFDGDPNAVVDQSLCVKGIEGPRVIDASVMPLIPSGNTNAPTIMIAERAAEMILGKPMLATEGVADIGGSNAPTKAATMAAVR